MNTDEIRAALAAATPDPWDESSSEATMNNRSAYRFGPRSAPAVFLAYQMRREDAHLIANAPTYIADLLAEVDRLAARADAAVQVMNEHNCGKAAEAAYRRAVRAEQAVQRVRELHAPMQHGPKGQRTICVHCFARYPCTTIRALDGGEQ